MLLSSGQPLITRGLKSQNEDSMQSQTGETGAPAQGEMLHARELGIKASLPLCLHINASKQGGLVNSFRGKTKDGPTGLVGTNVLAMEALLVVLLPSSECSTTDMLEASLPIQKGSTVLQH